MTLRHSRRCLPIPSTGRPDKPPSLKPACVLYLLPCRYPLDHPRAQLSHPHISQTPIAYLTPITTLHQSRTLSSSTRAKAIHQPHEPQPPLTNTCASQEAHRKPSLALPVQPCEEHAQKRHVNAGQSAPSHEPIATCCSWLISGRNNPLGQQPASGQGCISLPFPAAHTRLSGLIG